MYRPNRIESFNRKYKRTIKKKTLRPSNKLIFFRLESVTMKEIKVKPIIILVSSDSFIIVENTHIQRQKKNSRQKKHLTRKLLLSVYMFIYK